MVEFGASVGGIDVPLFGMSAPVGEAHTSRQQVSGRMRHPPNLNCLP
jgi:hypothetical protein